MSPLTVTEQGTDGDTDADTDAQIQNIHLYRSRSFADTDRDIMDTCTDNTDTSAD